MVRSHGGSSTIRITVFDEFLNFCNRFPLVLFSIFIFIFSFNKMSMLSNFIRSASFFFIHRLWMKRSNRRHFIYSVRVRNPLYSAFQLLFLLVVVRCCSLRFVIQKTKSTENCVYVIWKSNIAKNKQKQCKREQRISNKNIMQKENQQKWASETYYGWW